MKTSKLVLAAFLAPFLVMSVGANAEVTRDCVVEGTVKRHGDDGDRVYVAFDSAKPAEKGAPCRLKRRERLNFKASDAGDLRNAEPGTRVRYRYTEHTDKGASWKLQKASN
jgi:hypothetical protein